MLDASELRPPVQYEIWWVVLAVVIVVLIILWVVLVLFLTRRKKRPIKVVPVNLDKLKAKYLARVDEVRRDFTEKKLSARASHQSLSMLVRDFVFEATGFAASELTLSELSRSGYRELAELIAAYYPEEFAAITKGRVEEAVLGARKVVSSWR